MESARPTKIKPLNALLFINGKPPKKLPAFNHYQIIACSDGAFHYLENLKFPLDRLDFISGDFDSFRAHERIEQLANSHQIQIIETPDQNKTDFEKALEILLEREIKSVDIYGGSGGEMDHFLGNLTVAYKYKDQLKIRFIDEYSEYYFIPKKYQISGVKGRMISLFPFPFAENITTSGLNWPLSNGELTMTVRIGTRNFASEDVVNVEFTNGELLFFLGEKYH